MTIWFRPYSQLQLSSSTIIVSHNVIFNKWTTKYIDWGSRWAVNYNKWIDSSIELGIRWTYKYQPILLVLSKVWELKISHIGIKILTEYGSSALIQPWFLWGIRTYKCTKELYFNLWKTWFFYPTWSTTVTHPNDIIWSGKNYQ